MRLLIDTHALIWLCEGNPSLSATARAAMEVEANDRFISHAVPWEMAIKLSLVTLPQHHGDPFDRLMICQAQAEGLTIVTCDPHFAAYGVPLLW